MLDSFEKKEVEPILRNELVLTSEVNAFKTIILKSDKILSTNPGDKWFLSRDNEIVMFHYAIFLNNKYFINGSALSEKSNFFTHPFSSKSINIFKAKLNYKSSCFYEIQNVKAKLFCLPIENEFVFFPLLHTL